MHSYRIKFFHPNKKINIDIKDTIPEEFTNFVSICPPNQLEDPISSRGSITISRSLQDSIKHADAVIVLRLQKERMMENLLSSIKSYSENYCLTPEKLSLNTNSFLYFDPKACEPSSTKCIFF